MSRFTVAVVVGLLGLVHAHALAQDAPPTSADAPSGALGDATTTPAAGPHDEASHDTADGDAAQDASVDPSSGDPAPDATEQGTGARDADDADSDSDADDAGDAGDGDEGDATDGPSIDFHGTLEAAYGYNFNDPSNGVTAWRWYDARHDLIGLQSALLSANWAAGPVTGTLQLQFGALTELFWEGSRSIEEDLLWRLIQQATTEWQTPFEPLSLEGGVFNVPFGPEYNNAYLNWNWSTSNLFALMPYQIAGFRLNYDLGAGLTARAGVFNGWDQIISDNNGDKSMLLSLEYDDPNDEGNYVYVNYMVGVERDTGDPRGHNARHTFDLYGQWHAAQPVFLRAHVFGGFEAGNPGDDGWLGAALFGRAELHESFSISARGDVVRTFAGAQNLFHTDTLALNELGADTSTLLGSGTLTLDYHPFSFASLRLEVRHDRADFPLFFAGDVPTGTLNVPDPEGEDRPTATEQTTLTAGLTTWF